MNQIKFSEDQLNPAVDYNPISFMAFMAFGFSLLCITLAVVNPKLLSLTALSAALGGFVLFRMHTSNAEKGRKLAAFAFLASVFTLSMTVSYQSMRYKHLEATAIKHCETWLNLVKSQNVYDSHEMTIDFEDRQTDGVDLSRVYGPVDQPDPDMQVYLELEPERSIREIGPDAKIRRGRIAYQRPQVFYDRFEIHFHLDQSAKTEKDRHFTIVLLRTIPLKEKIYWEIEGLVNVDPPTPREKRHIGTVGEVSREILN